MGLVFDSGYEVARVYNFEQLLSQIKVDIYSFQVSNILLYLQDYNPHDLNTHSSKPESNTILMTLLKAFNDAGEGNRENLASFMDEFVLFLETSVSKQGVPFKSILKLEEADSEGNTAIHLALRYAITADTEKYHAFSEMSLSLCRILKDTNQVSAFVNLKNKRGETCFDLLESMEKAYPQYGFPQTLRTLLKEAVAQELIEKEAKACTFEKAIQIIHPQQTDIHKLKVALQYFKNNPSDLNKNSSEAHGSSGLIATLYALKYFEETSTNKPDALVEFMNDLLSLIATEPVNKVIDLGVTDDQSNTAFHRAFWYAASAKNEKMHDLFKDISLRLSDLLIKLSPSRVEEITKIKNSYGETCFQNLAAKNESYDLTNIIGPLLKGAIEQEKMMTRISSWSFEKAIQVILFKHVETEELKITLGYFQKNPADLNKLHNNDTFLMHSFTALNNAKGEDKELLAQFVKDLLALVKTGPVKKVIQLDLHDLKGDTIFHRAFFYAATAKDEKSYRLFEEITVQLCRILEFYEQASKITNVKNNSLQTCFEQLESSIGLFKGLLIRAIRPVFEALIAPESLQKQAALDFSQPDRLNSLIEEELTDPISFSSFSDNIKQDPPMIDVKGGDTLKASTWQNIKNTNHKGLQNPFTRQYLSIGALQKNEVLINIVNAIKSDSHHEKLYETLMELPSLRERVLDIESKKLSEFFAAPHKLNSEKIRDKTIDNLAGYLKAYRKFFQANRYELAYTLVNNLLNQINKQLEERHPNFTTSSHLQTERIKCLWRWLNDEDPTDEKRLEIFYNLLQVICALKNTAVSFFPSDSAVMFEAYVKEKKLHLSNENPFNQSDITAINSVEDIKAIIQDKKITLDNQMAC